MQKGKTGSPQEGAEPQPLWSRELEDVLEAGYRKKALRLRVGYVSEILRGLQVGGGVSKMALDGVGMIDWVFSARDRPTTLTHHRMNRFKDDVEMGSQVRDRGE